MPFKTIEIDFGAERVPIDVPESAVVAEFPGSRATLVPGPGAGRLRSRAPTAPRPSPRSRSRG